jgi:hypothetical protein
MEEEEKEPEEMNQPPLEDLTMEQNQEIEEAVKRFLAGNYEDQLVLKWKDNPLFDEILAGFEEVRLKHDPNFLGDLEPDDF